MTTIESLRSELDLRQFGNADYRLRLGQRFEQNGQTHHVKTFELVQMLLCFPNDDEFRDCQKSLQSVLLIAHT